MKAGTRGVLGLCWQQVSLPQGCKGRSLLWQLPCMNSALTWLPTSVLVPLRPPCPTEFSSSHETQDNCFRRRGIHIKPCYGLFWQWQWLHFGIQRWWRFQWWSSRNIRVSVYKTVFIDIRGSLPSSVISPEVSNSSQNILRETTINYEALLLTFKSMMCLWEYLRTGQAVASFAMVHF